MGVSFELLDKREYKLLLDPAAFCGALSLALADRFWTRRLKPLIIATLDERNPRKSRAEGKFSHAEQRIVTFFDTRKLLLDRHGFALRTREAVEDGARSGKPGVTLKFRTPDLLLAREFAGAANMSDDDKFEEDIALLQVAPKDGAGKRSVTTPRRPSIYSRFSVSLRRDLSVGLQELRGAFEQFEPFERELNAAEGSEVKKGRKLHAGPAVCEWVFEGAAVDLGAVDAGFAFTLWYFVEDGEGRNQFRKAASGGLQPRVAEISFDFKTKDGRVDADVSRRASKLLIAMRKKLPANRHSTSKTALALPPLR